MGDILFDVPLTHTPVLFIYSLNFVDFKTEINESNDILLIGIMYRPEYGTSSTSIMYGSVQSEITDEINTNF